MKWSDLKHGWISETMISIRSLRLGRSRQGDDAAFRLLTGLRRGQDDALSDSCGAYTHTCRFGIPVLPAAQGLGQGNRPPDGKCRPFLQIEIL